MLTLGRRFVIINTEEIADPPTDRLVIRLTPSHSYGHGWADDTAAMIESVERQIKPGDTVLDVGTGVGTLAFAALLLGAKHVTVTERDPDALEALRRNVAANGFEDRVTIVDGTLPASGPFDVVLCNIGAWAATEPHFDRMSRLANRAFVVSSEADTQHMVRARAQVHSMKQISARRAFNFSRALAPEASDWHIQELVR